MAKPLVAIVGRPNVGKSTFFNKIAGRRISIVEDVPGVTRDRVYADVEWMGRRFSMVDTGGLDMRSEDVLPLPDATPGGNRHGHRRCDLLFLRRAHGPDLRGRGRGQPTCAARSKPLLLVVNKMDPSGDE